MWDVRRTLAAVPHTLQHMYMWVFSVCLLSTTTAADCRLFLLELECSGCGRWFDFRLIRSAAGAHRLCLSANVCTSLLHVQDGEFGRSGAVKVHSALQKYLDGCCCQAGADSYHLRELNPYKGLYGKYCSKRRDIKLVAAAAASDKGMVRASQLHMAFGRESYLMGCRLLLESAEHNDAMLLSMFTGQVSMVARGDDLRGRRLPELSSRLVACVGECQPGARLGSGWLPLTASRLVCQLFVRGHAWCCCYRCSSISHYDTPSRLLPIYSLRTHPRYLPCCSIHTHSAANRAFHGAIHQCAAAARDRQDVADAPKLQGHAARQAAGAVRCWRTGALAGGAHSAAVGEHPRAQVQEVETVLPVARQAR